jgi:hypothetical protein
MLKSGKAPVWSSPEENDTSTPDTHLDGGGQGQATYHGPEGYVMGD